MILLMNIKEYKNIMVDIYYPLRKDKRGAVVV